MRAQVTPTSHSNIHQPQETRTLCPKVPGAVYAEVDGRLRLQLDVSRLRMRLQRLNVRPGSRILQQASALAAGLRLDPWDLLNLAVERALRPKTSRPNMKLVPYLTMLMWSIASSIHRARARAAAHGVTIPFDFVDEQVPDTRSIVDPVQTIIRRDEQAYYELLLGSVAGGDPLLGQLVDEIGLGQRGSVIEGRLGISTLELASLRRRLKRRAQAIALREGFTGVDKRRIHSA